MLENRRGGMVGEQAQGGGERSGWGRGRGPSRVGLQRHDFAARMSSVTEAGEKLRGLYMFQMRRQLVDRNDTADKERLG